MGAASPTLIHPLCGAELAWPPTDVPDFRCDYRAAKCHWKYYRHGSLQLVYYAACNRGTWLVVSKFSAGWGVKNYVK